MLFFTLCSLFAAETWTSRLAPVGLTQSPAEYLIAYMAPLDGVDQAAVSTHFETVGTQCLNMPHDHARGEMTKFLQELENMRNTLAASLAVSSLDITPYVWTTFTAVVIGQKLVEGPESTATDWRNLALAMSHLNNGHTSYRDPARYCLLRAGKEAEHIPSCFDYARLLMLLAASSAPTSWLAKESPDPWAEAFDTFCNISPEDRSALPHFALIVQECHQRAAESSTRAGLRTSSMDPAKHGDIVTSILQFLHGFVERESNAEDLNRWQAEAKTKTTDELRAAARNMLTQPIERLVYYLELLSASYESVTRHDLCFAGDAIADINSTSQTMLLARWMAAALFKASADKIDGGATACAKYAGAMLALYEQLPHMWENKAQWYAEALRYAKAGPERIQALFAKMGLTKTATETQLAFLQRVPLLFSEQERPHFCNEISSAYYIFGLVLNQNPNPAEIARDKPEIEQAQAIAKALRLPQS
ncbi:MAG: hypothetical protein AAB323_01025 [Pseudomonadota bacterium]